MRRWSGVMVLFSLFALFPLTSVPLEAQAQLAVPSHATVRIQSPVYSGEGTLVRMDADTMELGVRGLAQPVRVPVSSLTRLEYRRPATRRERATRGAIWGGAIFGLSGAALTDRDEDTSGWSVALAHAIPGALIGAGISLAIPRSRWERVPLSQGDGRP
jgi:hypothetical protein